MDEASEGVVWCGKNLHVVATDRLKAVPQGQTATKSYSSGEYQLFEIMGSGGLYLEIAYANWDNGDRDVRATVVSESGPLRRLEPNRLRLGIHNLSGNKSWVELSQARVQSNNPSQWSNSKMATYDQLNIGAGLDVVNKLREVSAQEIGSKAIILGQTGTRKNYLCATFENENQWCPIIAFVLTRILPLLNEYTG